MDYGPPGCLNEPWSNYVGKGSLCLSQAEYAALLAELSGQGKQLGDCVQISADPAVYRKHTYIGTIDGSDCAECKPCGDQAAAKACRPIWFVVYDDSRRHAIKLGIPGQPWMPANWTPVYGTSETPSIQCVNSQWQVITRRTNPDIIARYDAGYGASPASGVLSLISITNNSGNPTTDERVPATVTLTPAYAYCILNEYYFNSANCTGDHDDYRYCLILTPAEAAEYPKCVDTSWEECDDWDWEAEPPECISYTQYNESYRESVVGGPYDTDTDPYEIGVTVCSENCGD